MSEDEGKDDHNLKKKRLPYNACILSGGWARTLLALASRQVPV